MVFLHNFHFILRRSRVVAGSYEAVAILVAKGHAGIAQVVLPPVLGPQAGNAPKLIALRRYAAFVVQEALQLAPPQSLCR